MDGLRPWLRSSPRPGATRALLAVATCLAASLAACGEDEADTPATTADAAITKSDTTLWADAAQLGPDVTGGGTDAAAAPEDIAVGDAAVADDDAADDTGAAEDAGGQSGPTDAVSPPDAGEAADTAAPTDAAAVPDATLADVAADANALDSTGPAQDAGGADATAPDAGPATEPVVRFAAIGDTGKGNTEQYAVGAALGQKCKASGCDFVLLLGDNFYQTGVKDENDSQFKTKFEDPYKDVDAPFYVVLGNHDYGGEGAGYELWKGDHYKKYSQKNPKFHHPDNAWDKVVQHVHLFAIDSNLMMYGLGKPQVDKYGPMIKESKATWKIVFAHHPYLSNGKHGNAGMYEGIPFIPIVSGDGVKKAYDDIVCGKIDLLITGHDHSRQWLKQSDKCPGVELIVSGAGASTTEIKDKSFLFTPSPAWYEDADKEGFFWVELAGKKMRGEFYDSDGKLAYSREFTKN